MQLKCHIVILQNGHKAWKIDCNISESIHWTAVIPFASPYCAVLCAIVKLAHKQTCPANREAKIG